MDKDNSLIRNRIGVIFNPRSGQGVRGLRPVLDALKSLGAACELLETRCAGDGMERARQALATGNLDALVAAGGDGTINEVANGMIGSDLPLGIIPAGTANVLSYELNLPRSPSALAEMLVRGAVRTVYPGKVNGRYFLLMVGAGLDARAVSGVSLSFKKLWGKGAYALAVLQEFLTYDPPSFRVIADCREYPAAWVLVFKASRYAGNWVAEPEARMEVPSFSVVLLRARTRGQLIPNLLDFALRKPLTGAEICLRGVRQVRIEGPSGEPAQMDGDFIGNLPLEIEMDGVSLKLIDTGPQGQAGR